ncbi:hypothetical protein C8A05DRAFT_42357 [Staphylotrichum tortipilum]|uniref:MARVEL domain-containing protein n=1 Tax=Staphylotrichum tortipilum TaxID=2831512 RepID=A0AAN6MP82_9PEZI|nr:hypothetical protein C8A05DRAFT_42357 [Staphylotrichum longicolle]
MERFVPIVHGVTAAFAVVELGLTAYLVSPWWATPSILSFMLFSSVWSLLVLGYVFLMPLYYARFFQGLAALAIESITMIFWFAGSIALAAYWGAPRCGGNKFCGSVEGVIAFGFFLWVLFSFLVLVDTLSFWHGRVHDAADAAEAAPKPADIA